MKSIIAVLDTNFLLALRRASQDVKGFLNRLARSFDENDIDVVIPSRVLGEVESFDDALARFLELQFKVAPPVDLEKNRFFLNMKWVNRNRRKNQRFFHVGEITDLEVITVAKEIHDSLDSRSNSILEREVWIVSDDEGIKKATQHFLDGRLKVVEASAFLGYLLGVTNDEQLQNELESISKEVFDYFTSYRKMQGREPVSQLAGFFADMLGAIRSARKDLQAFFDVDITGAFDRYIVLGDPLPDELSIYQDALNLVKDAFGMEDDVFLKHVVNDLANLLVVTLDQLAERLKEPSNYTRFYNFLSIYILRIMLLAFKRAFIGHALPIAHECLQLAKFLTVQGGAMDSTGKTRIALLMTDIIFHMASGRDDGDKATPVVKFLEKRLLEGNMPPQVPLERVLFILAMYSLLEGKPIKTMHDSKHDFKITRGEMQLGEELTRIVAYLIEDFCDELTSFGNHRLALKLYSGIRVGMELPADDLMRIEGKIYLACLILDENLPAGATGCIPDDYDRTCDPLEGELLIPEFKSIHDIGGTHYTKRIKVLGRMRVSMEGYVDFACWVYPLRSKFIVSIPADRDMPEPSSVKEIRIRGGQIKVIPLAPGDAPGQHFRGRIIVDREADVEFFTYQEKFFTLNLI